LKKGEFNAENAENAEAQRKKEEDSD